jgi:hypothetical protein
MSKKISVKGWQLELDWQGMTLTPPEQVAKSGDRYREVTFEAWAQTADVFTPGGLLFAPAPARRRREKESAKLRDRRRIR